VPASHFKLRRIRQQIRGAKKRRRGSIVADINVTPLVDVVLVLLIIFMVVTPMIARGVPVDLPKTMHHSKKPDDGKDIIVSVTKDKQVYITSNPVQMKDIPRIIEEERRRFPEKTVYVKGDSRANYGVMRDVMEAIHKANIDDVMLGTDDVKEKK
jgi:biopolymer transport protein ExbD